MKLFRNRKLEVFCAVYLIMYHTNERIVSKWRKKAINSGTGAVSGRKRAVSSGYIAKNVLLSLLLQMIWAPRHLSMHFSNKSSNPVHLI